MSSIRNPALQHLQSLIGNGLAFAEIWIAPIGSGYEVRHLGDRDAAAASLRTITAQEARTLSNFTATGAFRPIKASPDLVAGWRLDLSGASELEFALNQIYPGAIADLNAVKTSHSFVTHFREYAERQTGMYRITAMLSDTQAASMTRACCDKRSCLKQRLWSVPGLATDDQLEKSLIPCLEPCPLLMEFARKTQRVEQEASLVTELRPEEVEVLRSALEFALSQTPTQQRVADFNDCLNPRRVRLLLEKLPPHSTKPSGK